MMMYQPQQFNTMYPSLFKRAASLFAICMIQGLVVCGQSDKGAIINIPVGAQVVCNGSFINNSGTVNNSGTIKIGGDVINNGTMNSNAGSLLVFEGTALQTISGSPVNAWNLLVNNAAGLELNTNMNISGTMTFTSGNIATGNNVVVFANGSNIGGMATDASHINGKVRFDGVGAFIYPTGSGVRYQPVLVNLNTNSNGLTASYHGGNAGTGTFSTTGSTSTPIVSYNANEYWMLNPAGSVSGSVTLSWDGYNDTYGNPLTERVVARKAGSLWVNEGGIATGTTSSGSVTSNIISGWGLFALGSTDNVLPLKWISLNGRLNNARQAELNWVVQEYNTSVYEIEKSNTGTLFLKIGLIGTKGEGINKYRFNEGQPLAGTAFYRIRQVDKDGKFSYSSTLKISANESVKLGAAIYPTLVQTSAILHISVPDDMHLQGLVVNAAGQVMMRRYLKLAKGMNLVPMDLGMLTKGVYTVRLVGDAGNLSIPFIRQ